MRKLKLLFAAAAIMMGVGTASAREDVTTTFLKNGDLSALTGWTIDASQPGHDTWNGYTDHQTNGVVNVLEFYSAWNPNAGGNIGNTRTFDFSQTATLPQGYYRLKVNGFYREGNNNPTTNQQKAYIYAGTKQQYLEGFAGFYNQSASSDLYRAAACFGAGYYENEFDFDMDAEGQIQIGFHGYIDTYCSWCIIGPVTLYKYEMSDFAADFNTKKAQAEALYSSPMNATVLATLQEKANVDQTAWTTKAQITDAESELNVAISAANASIVYYAEAKGILDAANGYDADGQASYADDATIAAIQAAYNDGTLEKVTDEQKAAANAALATACKAQNQPADGCDMTVYIVNPGIDGNVNGWTCNINNNGGYAGGPLKPSNDAMEFWAAGTLTDQDKGKSFDYYQTLTGLPEGAYTVSVYMLNSTNGETGAVWDGCGKAGLYASTASKDVDVRVTTDDETFRPYTTAEILVLSGELRIGVKNFEALTGRWFAADDFKLTYVRQLNDEEKATIAKTEYETALAAAQAIESGTIPTKNYQTLQGVIANNTVPDGSTAELYEAATENLNKAATANAALVEPYATWKILCAQGKAIAPQSQHPAVYNAIVLIETAVEENLVDAATLENGNTMATSLIRDYSAWLELKGKATVLLAVPNDDDDANRTLSSSLTSLSNGISNFQVTNMIQAQQLVAFIPQQTASLKQAMTDYVFAASPVGDGEQFDLTFMLTNPDLTGLPTWTGAAGWATEQNGGNSQVMTNGNATSIDGTKTAFYEYWKNPPTQENVFALYLETTLPVGTYYMSCYAFAQYEQEGLHENRPNGVYFYANDVQGTAVNNARLSEQSIEFVNTKEQNVMIGLKPVEGNGNTWMGIGYVQLFKVPAAADVELDESVAYEEIETAANVKLTKNIYKGWNTIILPFSMSLNEVTEVFGDGDLYAFTGDDEDGTLNFTDNVNELAPHTPYLFKADADKNIESETIVGRTITVSTNNLTTAGNSYNLVGTYAPYDTDADENPIVVGKDYILGEDNNFHKTTVKNALKAFRAYIQAKEEGGEARLAIVIDGQTTAIDAIDGRMLNENAAIYNLAGQKVSKAQKGLYIRNGKKLVVK